MDQEIARAVAEGNAKRAGELATVLRFRRGMTYDQISDYACLVAGIEPNEWESLMYEADEEDNQS
jgi:hypothetical protein